MCGGFVFHQFRKIHQAYAKSNKNPMDMPIYRVPSYLQRSDSSLNLCLKCFGTEIER